MAGANAPIIIKKKKKGGHGHGHHGGAWKVAYADFVTAMMAFFLLLWLLNVTTDEQRRGIADYFDPASVSRTSSGSGGVLGGLTVGTPGHMSSPSSEFTLERAMPGREEPAEDSNNIDDGDVRDPVENPGDGLRGGTAVASQGLDGSATAGGGASVNIDAVGEYLAAFADQPQDQRDSALDSLRNQLGEETFDAVIEELEHRQFAEAAGEILAALESSSGLALDDYGDNLVIEETPDGLRIQILDREQSAMFESGSSDMMDHTASLMQVVADAIAPLTNEISISGHTDSRPFRDGSSYDNWDLSVDRANASRRALIEFGIPADRIANVVGLADTQPMFPDDAADPRNRRISIVLLSRTTDSGQSPRL